MQKLVLVVLVVAALGGAAFYAGLFTGDRSAQAASARGGAPPGGRAGGSGRAAMTVEVAAAHRTSIAEQVTVVGNLVGDVTVTVVPRIAGRLQDISVRLGDRVSRGQRLARIEDFELVEQVRQAEAAQEVSLATIRQREADLSLAATTLDRARNLFARDLVARQALDDNEARHQAALAQLDLARAQAAQSKARLDELRITLANTVIVSPVDGFVSRRLADPGALVSPNAPIAEVVDITRVRLVVHVVERDLQQITRGDTAQVEVDAYPGEAFSGRIARVAPVLDPATRTAPIEIEIPNPGFRLKPGMYARVGVTTGRRKDALVVPVNALVDLGGRRGVFLPVDGIAIFRLVQVGTEQRDVVEILAGLSDGDPVITTGAGALRDGDRIVVANGRETSGPHPHAGPAAPDAGAAIPPGVQARTSP